MIAALLLLGIAFGGLVVTLGLFALAGEVAEPAPVAKTADEEPLSMRPGALDAMGIGQDVPR